ncbi:MAG: glycosyl transferase, family 2 [Bacteroidota bacterium]|nr:glycosyl transferase, family 2 [Bacteroidota bacterium]
MITIVIPTYNSEKHIDQIVEKLLLLLRSTMLIKEVIFVNDCSNDQTLSRLQLYKNKYPDKIRIIHLKRNFGQHPATLIGMLYVKTEYCLTMDDDVLFDELDLDKLIIQTSITPSRLIYITRPTDKKKKFKFFIITRLLKYLSNTKSVSAFGSSQRFFNISFLQNKFHNPLHYIYLDVLFLKWGMETAYIENNYSKHSYDHMRYSNFQRLRLMFYSIVFYRTHTKITPLIPVLTCIFFILWILYHWWWLTVIAVFPILAWICVISISKYIKGKNKEDLVEALKINALEI